MDEGGGVFDRRIYDALRTLHIRLVESYIVAFANRAEGSLKEKSCRKMAASADYVLFVPDKG